MTAAALFQSAFGAPPRAVAWTPGRVNLLGEHIDYNGGFVLPTPIARGVSVAIGDGSPNGEDIEIVSDRFGAAASRSYRESACGVWSDLVLGAALKAFSLGAPRRALRVAVAGDLPHGAGLSSSAALVVGMLRALLTTVSPVLDGPAIAMAAREVENDFIGVPCGIMDQMAVALAKPGQALGLDCASLAATPIPISPDWRFAVFHSGETRALADGRYAARRAECADAARRLGVNQLCRAEQDAIARLEELPAPLAARARHAVTENARARAGAAALLARDMSAFAHLMNESHLSLRDDFEVTTPWIDRLVQASRRAGASGARMTGGGFGGCIVSLIARDDEPRWAASLASEFPDLRFLA